MSWITDAIADWFRQILTDGIIANFTGMFNEVNKKVGEIAVQVGQTPQGWNANVFNLIRTLSETVIIPIAGIILTFVLCYELITMIIDKNNMHDFQTYEIWKWIFKTFVAVFILTHTFDIVMGIFDLAQHVVNQSAGVIGSSLNMNLALDQLGAQLAAMSVGELLGLYIESAILSLAMKAISLCVFIVIYGRMLEIYMVCSVAPIPFSTMVNREWGHIGNSQVLFPRSGIRFIAVNENYDSLTVQGYTGNILVPFKNITNDAYCADLSVKVRSHLDIKRKKGDFVGSFAVYGYTKAPKDPNAAQAASNARKPKNSNMLIIDDFAAEVVRDIYNWKLEGMSCQGIAERLNRNGVLSPMEYKRFLGLRYNTSFKVNATAVWQSVTVKRILTNAVYLGVLEQGKREKPNYKVRKSVYLPQERWICTEDAHEPIIDRSIYDTVQELLKHDTRASKSGENVFPLSGIILCGDCGGAMVRKTNTAKGVKYPYYVCGKHRADKTVCTTHIVSATECEDAVLQALRLHTSAVLDVEKALACAESMKYRQDGVRKLTARLEAKQDEIKRYNEFRLSLHESYREGVISKADFLTLKDCERKIAELEIRIQELELSTGQENTFVERFSRQVGITELTRPIIEELISEVKIYSPERIEIVFNYADEYAKIVDLTSTTNKPNRRKTK